MKFNFGNNWQNFIDNKLDEERVDIAEKSLIEFSVKKNRKEKTFLDIGSGSGLFSLAAKRLGYKVISMDVDQDSVNCTKFLKKKYFKNNKNWKIFNGSILDEKIIEKMPNSDVVYSWGVLHHTGHMWLALDNCIRKLKPKGKLFIAIYNDQGIKSRLWWIVKYIYNYLPNYLKKIYFILILILTYFFVLLKKILLFDLKNLFNYILNVKQNRGMSFYYNMLDWIGGYPYEYSSFENLKKYCENKGLKVIKFKKNYSLGCHQIVFKKN